MMKLCNRIYYPKVLKNFEIINSITKLHLVCISTEQSTMHGSMSIKNRVLLYKLLVTNAVNCCQETKGSLPLKNYICISKYIILQIIHFTINLLLHVSAKLPSSWGLTLMLLKRITIKCFCNNHDILNSVNFK
jgi:hypothetical protein